jgi:Holliday junction resolvase
MVNGRNKGASFEREIAGLLFDELGIKFKRDLEQYRSADHGDLLADDPAFPFVIECKRYASGTSCKAAWWQQAQAAASAVGKMPVVIYKYDRRDIRCVVEFTALYKMIGSSFESDHQAEMTLGAFCYIAREIMNGTD